MYQTMISESLVKGGRIRLIIKNKIEMSEEELKEESAEEPTDESTSEGDGGGVLAEPNVPTLTPNDAERVEETIEA